MKITVDDMRSRGKIGYVAKLKGSDKVFLKPVERSGYGGSHQVLTFELTEDGIYEIQSANYGHRKTTLQYVKIADGVETTADTLYELITSDANLPELEGTTKQVDWANSIRAKFVARLKLNKMEIPEGLYKRTAAKWWIDNRVKLEQ